jgi:hypothetical protein
MVLVAAVLVGIVALFLEKIQVVVQVQNLH